MKRGSHSTKQSHKKLYYFLLFVFPLLQIFWAYFFPMTNDEVYYWDWGRSLHLSYIDHPLGVALLSYLGHQLGNVRLLVPFVHLFSVLLLLSSLKLLSKNNVVPYQQRVRLLILAQLLPIFSWEGFVLIPDVGLIFATSLSLYLALKSLKMNRLSLSHSLKFGFSLGLAFIFKYHAVPIGFGICAALFYLRRDKLRKDVYFWILSFITALVVSFPVLWWNIQNDYASFWFQGVRGFSSLEFRLIPFLQTCVGLLVMISPYILYVAIKDLWVKKFSLSLRKDYPELIPIFAGLPLFILLFFVSFGKQTLPHWFVPGFWLLIPVLALHNYKNKWIWKLNLVFCVILSVILPTLLCSDRIRHFVVAKGGERPGELAELTFWEDMVKNLEQQKLFQERESEEPIAGTCPKYTALASLRWYWTAQLAYHLPNKKKLVTSLDLDHRSYYDFRDSLKRFEGCDVLIVGDRRHYDKELLSYFVNLGEVHSFFVKDAYGNVNQEREIILVRGKFKKRSNEIYPFEIHDLSYRELLDNDSSLGENKALKAYFGLLHSHTSVSDGIGTLKEAYAHARDVAHLDFFAVTDHAEYWDLPYNKDSLFSAKGVARDFTTDKFLALAGFEYSHPLFGHYNVYGTEDHYSWLKSLKLSSFYNWLKDPKQKEAVVFFNHPGLHFYMNSYGFNKFAFDTDLQKKFVGVDVIQWGVYRRFFFGFEGVLSYYDEALSKGWKLAPLASQDNHYGQWGTLDEGRTAILMESLSETNLLEALRKRHFYATTHPNIHLSFEVKKLDGTWSMMGSELSLKEFDSREIPLRIRIFDPKKGVTAQKLEILIDGKVLSSLDFEKGEMKEGYEFYGKLNVKEQNPFGMYLRFYEFGKEDTLFTQSAPFFFGK